MTNIEDINPIGYHGLLEDFKKSFELEEPVPGFLHIRTPYKNVEESIMILVEDRCNEFFVHEKLDEEIYKRFDILIEKIHRIVYFDVYKKMWRFSA